MTLSRARSAAALITVALLAPAAAPAQRPAGTASPTATAFFEALGSERWGAAAALVEPASAARFREAELSLLLAWAQRRGEMRRARAAGGGSSGMIAYTTDGTLDPKLLERYAATPLRAVPGVRTLGELAALPPADFLARLLAVGNAERGLARFIPTSRPVRRVLGEVVEGDSVAHVVYRHEGQYIDPLHVNVLHLRRGPRGWLVTLSMTDHDVLGPVGLLMTMDADEPPQRRQ